MLKNILNLKGAQQLSKEEQSSINGGLTPNWCAGKPDYTSCGLTSVCCCWICVPDGTHCEN